MIRLIETIKRVAVNAVEAQKPVHVLYGKVIAETPLKVQIAQNQVYTQEFFIQMESAPAFRVGDRLVLLRVQGGQEVLILGRR